MAALLPLPLVRQNFIDVETAAAKKRWALAVLEKGRRVWQAGFDGAEVLTASGTAGGAISVTRQAVATNSSNRSVLEQAVIAVNAKYKVHLAREGFSAPGCVVSAPRPTPMLVKESSKVVSPETNLFPGLLQVKRDGVRCLVDRDEHGAARFTSRQRNGLDHLSHTFGEAAAAALLRLPPGTVLDGELVVPGSGGKAGLDNFQAAVSAAKTLAPAAAAALTFVVFDLHIPSAPATPFFERVALAAMATHQLPKIAHCPAFPVCSLDDASAALAAAVIDGAEGIVVRRRDSVYEPGKRPNTVAKFKMFDEEEGTIVDVVAGEGKESAAALFVVAMSAGSTVPTVMHPRGSIAAREQLLRDAAGLLGKSVTVQFQGRTRDGVLRFPVVKAVRDYE